MQVLASFVVFNLLALSSCTCATEDGNTAADSRFEASAFSADDNAGDEGPLRFVFIKTHKTGSSTLMVMLGQALERRGLYPAIGNQHSMCITCLGWPESLADPGQQIFGPQHHPISAFLSHMRYTSETAATVLRTLGPPLDVPVFTILRDPLTRFLSALKFFHPAEFSGAGIDLNTFTDASMNRLLDLAEDQRFVEDMWLWHRAHVLFSYAFDLGITDNPFLDRGEFEREFDKAKARIGLVLLTEEWHLSMALLRRFVPGLGFRDFVWNNQKTGTRSPSVLGEETRARIRRVLWMDYAIYDHFKEQFYQRITPAIQFEAQVIRQTHDAYTRRCSAHPGSCRPREDDAAHLRKRLQQDSETVGSNTTLL